MLDKPYPVREDSTDFIKYFFFNGRIYEISQLTFFGREVAIHEVPLESQLDEFLQQVTSAFLATGPDFAFVPVFKIRTGDKQ